jgi:hypothetical protein
MWHRRDPLQAGGRGGERNRDSGALTGGERGEKEEGVRKLMISSICAVGRSSGGRRLSKQQDLYPARKMGGSQADAVVDVNLVATVLPMRLHCGGKLLVRERRRRRVDPGPRGGGRFDGIQRRRLLPRSNLKIGGGKPEAGEKNRSRRR